MGGKEILFRSMNLLSFINFSFKVISSVSEIEKIEKCKYPVGIQVSHYNKVLFIWITALGIFNHRTKSVNLRCRLIGVGMDDYECGIEVAA